MDKNRINKIINGISYSIPLLFILNLVFLYVKPIIADMQINPFHHARITDIEYRAVLEDDNIMETTVHVTERVTFDVHASSRNNLYWELWRDLSEDYIDGKRTEYEIKSVAQIDSDGEKTYWPESYKLYWEESDYVGDGYDNEYSLGPGKWFYSPGPYDEARRRYEALFFYVDGLYREKITFEIEYDIFNAVFRYNDCCDLYIEPFYGSTITYLESFDGEILIPLTDMPAKGNYDVFTYGTKGEDFPIKESDKYPGYHAFIFDLDEDDLKFDPYNKYLEFELVAYGDDYRIFADNSTSNYYSTEDVLPEIYDEHDYYAEITEKSQSKKAIVLAICVALSLWIIVCYVKKERSIHSKHIFYNPEYNYDFYREVPGDLDPYFAATLVHCKHKKPKDDSCIYSALLLSLAQKEYVGLTELGDDVEVRILRPASAAEQKESSFTPDTIVTNDQYIMYTEDTPATLTPCEAYYFNLLLRHVSGDRIMMSNFRTKIVSDYSNTADFADNMKQSIVNIGVSEGYFQKGKYDEIQKNLSAIATFLFWVGIILLIPVNIISYFTRMDLAFGGYTILGVISLLFSVLYRKMSYKYPLLTDFGETEYAKWRGLYNYLNSEPLITENGIIDLPVWERYLVYATAFGLADKVNKAIKIRCPQFDTNEKYRNSGYSSRHFHRHTGRNFHRSVRTGTYNHTYSSSGYYGGGGGGGG